jgi:hypothetical protein
MGKCSLCRSEGTTKVSCPLNPECKHPNYDKHPLAGTTAKPMPTATAKPLQTATAKPLQTATAKSTLPVNMGASPRITAVLTQVDPAQTYEHSIFDHGGRGDCGYLSFVAGLNSIQDPKHYTYQDMRELVAQDIEYMENFKVQMLYIQEYPRNKQPSSSSEILEARKILADATRAKRWATEYDLAVLSQAFDVGIFLFDHRTGNLYVGTQSYNDHSYYITMYYGHGSMVQSVAQGTHYQTVGFRLRNSTTPYRYAFSCDQLPKVLIDLVNPARMKHLPPFRCRGTASGDCKSPAPPGYLR